MKKTWKTPTLELLDIKETLASWHGNTNDWTIIGRKYQDVQPGDPQDPAPEGS